MISDITYLGKIIRVDSNNVEIEISNEIPSFTPVIGGKVYKIGQIGTFVRIVSGNINSFGIVSSVSNSPSNNIDELQYIDSSSRFLSVSIIGEKVGSSPFEKGIGAYPTINDEVHIVTDKDLAEIYGKSDNECIEIGKHSSSDELTVYANLHKLVLRHVAILGSTGSGKSNSVVSILKRILTEKDNSRIILIDPHGEYASAFPKAKVLRINDEKNPLLIPFWLMNFDELAYFLVGATPSDEARPDYRKFREMITKEKKSNSYLSAGAVDVNYITADSPIPFSIRKLWYEMNWWLNATFSESASDKQNNNTAQEITKGDAEYLIPAEFQAYSMSNQAPYKSRHQELYGYEKKLITKLKDSRYDFLFNPKEYTDSTSTKDLHNLLQDWIGNSEKLTILDLSNVPFEVLDITVGLITRFIYDSMFWGRHETYTGRNRPLLIAYEEAHSYLGKNDATKYAKTAVERIFKEGRKFGIGAMVISQRPSELSETILAQVGTFVSLRLTNSSDQSIVKSLAPDNMNALINLLPSLRIGEAIIVGEAINIPSRIKFPLQKPIPDSSDPNLAKKWSDKYISNENDYKSVVTKIREQKF